MRTISTGDVFTAARQKEGDNPRFGHWEIIGTNEKLEDADVIVFVRNTPSGVATGESFRIDKILSITDGLRRNETDTWVKAIGIDAEVSRMEESNDK